jgi:hypothetical protein
MNNCHDECEDFSFEHCSKYLHKLRIRKCKYDPCLLLHDPNHLLTCDHKEQYQNMANKNFIHNKNHPIFMEDIWKNIHEFLDDPKLIVACDCSRFKDRIKSVNNLLKTSRIFSILLKTDLKSVNTWTYDNNTYAYKFKEISRWMKACYCSYPCLNCPNVKPPYTSCCCPDSSSDDSSSDDSSSDDSSSDDCRPYRSRPHMKYCRKVTYRYHNSSSDS